MSNKPHRESANDARKAAGDAQLSNVRDRELRSAAAHDALAQQSEDIAAKVKQREAQRISGKGTNEPGQEGAPPSADSPINP